MSVNTITIPSIIDDKFFSETGFRYYKLYDYSKSTEDNFAEDSAPFIGKYEHLRRCLDYEYHRKYSVERQLLHDRIIDLFSETVIHDGEITCDAPTENWLGINHNFFTHSTSTKFNSSFVLVFTAGPMGAGKSHTLQWLSKQGYFPLEAFVRVDPDELRELLPENAEYCYRDANTAGSFTQKEVGYISEVMTLDALNQGKNVIVDGSLRDAHWYTTYILEIKRSFPKLKIAIMEVYAPEETVITRAKLRAKKKGRVVPEKLIRESVKQIPDAIKILSPLADFVCRLTNDDVACQRSRNETQSNYSDGSSNYISSHINNNNKSNNNNNNNNNKSNNNNNNNNSHNINNNNDNNDYYTSNRGSHVYNNNNSTASDTTKIEYTCSDPKLTYTSRGLLSWKAFTNVWKMKCPPTSTTSTTTMTLLTTPPPTPPSTIIPTNNMNSEYLLPPPLRKLQSPISASHSTTSHSVLPPTIETTTITETTEETTKIPLASSPPSFIFEILPTDFEEENTNEFEQDDKNNDLILEDDDDDDVLDKVVEVEDPIIMKLQERRFEDIVSDINNNNNNINLDSISFPHCYNNNNNSFQYEVCRS